MTFAPQITVCFDGFGTLCAVAFVFFAAGWWGSKITADREWEADIRRRVSQQIEAPWLKVGEPVVLNRPDARDTIFKANPYREDGFDPLQWAA